MTVSTTVGIFDLPEEVLYHVFRHLSLPDLVLIQRTCKLFYEVAQSPLLWRAHCLTQYKYWHSVHSFRKVVQSPAVETNWRELLRTRKQQDERIKRNMESVLLSQTDRIPKIKGVLSEGEDARDMLEAMRACSDDAEDVLARRFWSNEIIGCIQRAQALDVWKEARTNRDYPLERALAAIDYFICEDPPETIDQLSLQLDVIHEAFCRVVPTLEGLSDRNKALLLAKWLVSENLVGVSDDRGHSEFKNSLLMMALCDAEHESLPVISAAIFCSIGHRIGLNAHLVNYPNQVFVTVKHRHGWDLDGNPLVKTQADLEPSMTMFVDLLAGGVEITASALRSQLWVVPQTSRSSFAELKPASTPEMMYRVAKNLENRLSSFKGPLQRFLDNATTDFLPPGVSEIKPTLITLQRASYCVLWLKLMFSPMTTALLMDATLRDFTDALTTHFEEFDASLVQDYLIPVLENSQGEREFMLDILRAMHVEDTRPKIPQRRDAGTLQQSEVRFRVGDVFVHKRFGYQGMIYGWDQACAASDAWIQHMRIDALSGGRQQAFYNVLDEDLVTRYVADQNIHLVAWGGIGLERDGFRPAETLMRVAGRHFKRWDQEKMRFVNNIKEQFPDD